MAMVLSSQSRLLVALCFTVLVLAGALTVGSLVGWFTPVFSEPMPAKLQVERTDYPSSVRREAADRSDEGDLGNMSPSLTKTSNAGRYRGVDGESGTKGLVGEFARGPPGPPGPPGLPGIAGEASTCTCNLTTLLKNGLGTNFPYSLAVTAGKDGLLGSTGNHGPRGDKGERGLTGPPGPKGERGKEGLPGPPGPPGLPKSQNFDGINEFQLDSLDKESAIDSVIRPGLAGRKGEPGKIGAVGPRGERGATGSRGPIGLKGDRGDRGLPGEKGAQGLKGETGMDGFPGTSGSPGKKGDVGPPGPPGTPGVVKQKGTSTIIECPPGPPGIDGADGLKGEPGVPGPRGWLGSQGMHGDKGERGMDGTAGPSGPLGPKGEKGDVGPPGEIFIHNQNLGVNEITVIKGEKGEGGRRGRTGKPGLQGPPGPPGVVELSEWPGPPGPMGPKGEKGDSQGIMGNQKGDKGDKGDRGVDGLPGRDGKDLESRFIPVPGPPGPPGPPGLPGMSIIGPKGEPGRFDESSSNLRSDAPTDFPPMAHAVTQQKDTPQLGAIAFKSRSIMLEATKESPIGTMVYIIEEESLLVRVSAGWQYVALGALLHIDQAVQLIPSSTTVQPQLYSPFEASNLINRDDEDIPNHISFKSDALPDGDNEANFNETPFPVTAPGKSQVSRTFEDVKTTQFASLRIAALNDPYSGNTGGVWGADYACYREALRAGLKGTFRAFLSSRSEDVSSKVRPIDRVLPVCNLRGEVLFDSWQDMFDGRGAPFPHQPRIFSFNGKNVMNDPHWPIKSVWHGALRDGTRALDVSCDAWNTAHYDQLGLAGNLQAQMLMDGQYPMPCDKKLILLCVETTSDLLAH